MKAEFMKLHAGGGDGGRQGKNTRQIHGTLFRACDEMIPTAVSDRPSCPPVAMQQCGDFR
jgi:hypothetical protein